MFMQIHITVNATKKKKKMELQEIFVLTTKYYNEYDILTILYIFVLYVHWIV